MRKNFIVLLILSLLLVVTGCNNSDNNKNEEKSAEATSSQTTSAESQAEKTDQSEQSEQKSDNEKTESNTSKNESSSQTNLVMKSFGELWMGDRYYIDVLMTQEYDSNKLGSVSEKTENSNDKSENDSTQKKVVYDYIIAVDFEKNVAGLNMFSDNGSKCTVVKDYKIYTINHSDKTYTCEPYNGLAENYGEQFTVNICLGIINNCTLINSGKTTYKEKEVKYEKYKVESQLDSVKDAEIIYYFDSSDKPVAEIVTTEIGKTTFEFRNVLNTIPVPEILEVPENYKEIKEKTESSSAS